MGLIEGCRAVGGAVRGAVGGDEGSGRDGDEDNSADVEDVGDGGGSGR